MTDERTRSLDDGTGEWTAIVAARPDRVSVAMEDITADTFWWAMTPEKAREFARTLLAQADMAEGKAG